MAKSFRLSARLCNLYSGSEIQMIRDFSLDLSLFSKLLGISPELALIHSRKILIRMLQYVSCHNETGHLNFNLNEMVDLCYKKSLLSEKIRSVFLRMNLLSDIAFNIHQFPLGYSSEKKLHEHDIDSYLIDFELILYWFHKLSKGKDGFERIYFNLAPELMKEVHFEQICELEKKYPPQFRTSSEVMRTWHQHNPNIYTVITDVPKKNVIGLIEALPLQPEYSGKLYQSELNDTEIPTGAIQTFDRPDIFKLYISSVIIDTFYYNSDIFIFMFDAFLKKLLMLARKGIYFSEVFADIINPQGRKIARYWEMEKAQDTAHGSSIYKLSLLPPSLEELLHITDHKTAETLNFYYERKFKEMKEVFEAVI